MFDYIIVEEGINLPIPEEMIGLGEIEYQTKSLDKTLSFYLIGKDKNLYLTDSFFEEDKTKIKEKLKIDYHGVIKFGAYKTTDLVDYSLDFEAKFTDGILQDIRMVGFEKFFHESRSKTKEDFLNRQKIYKRKISTRLSNAIKNYIIYPIFKFFGLSYSRIEFCCPEIVFLRRVIRNAFSQHNFETKYGFFASKIDTGICFSKSKYSSQFVCKFLGFGFIYQNFNPIDI